MLIEIKRLIIRHPRQSDAKPLNDAINRSLGQLTRWMPWAVDPSLKTTKQFINKGIEQWNSNTQNDL